MNRRLLILALMLIAMLVLASCGKTKYNVDYHGQKDFFKGAKDAYAEGENVTLRYDIIATDTDYSFFVDGAESYDVSWEKEAYVIRFKMPAADVEVYCEHHNSMVYIPGNTANLYLMDTDSEIPEGEAGIKAASFEDGILEYTVVNNSSDPISYGAAYSLMYKEGGEYKLLEPTEEPMWIMIAYELQPGMEESYTANLDFYEDLKPGEYRFVKTENLFVDFELVEYRPYCKSK